MATGAASKTTRFGKSTIMPSPGLRSIISERDHPASGDHTNSLYRYNTITSCLNKMDLGISVGMKGWFPDIDTFGGSIINNSVSGAAINLDIYGYHDGTVNNNTLSNPQGSFAGIGANYAAAEVANVCMQPGWVVRAVNIVGVSTWDTGEVLSSTCRGGTGTQSLLPGATPSSFSVPAGWQVYSYAGV